MGEQRRSQRLDSLNMLHFQLLGPGAPYATRGMGRTLNVSEVGLLLEVYEPMSQGQELLVTVGLENDLVDLRARVVYAKPEGERAHHVGIEFLEMDSRGRATLLRYYEAFQAAQG